MSITVFGSVNVDLTAYVDNLPMPGVTAHAKNYLTGLGGKGANQAVEANRLSSDPVRLVGAVGADAFGESARSFLREFGVSDQHLVIMDNEPTGIALIHVDAESQNSITVVGGANMVWSAEGPEKGVFQDSKIALFQLETPVVAIASAMQNAREAGAMVILDPAPAPEASKLKEIEPLLQLSDIITPNESEAEAISGIAIHNQSDAFHAAKVLKDKGIKSVVIKLGADGLVFMGSDGSEGYIPPFKVKPIDTVAAGDCFNGALAVALAEGRTLPEALRFAAGAGALATEKPGAATAAPYREQLDRLLKEQ